MSSNTYVSLFLRSIQLSTVFSACVPQRLCTGAVVWKRLKHPNVASFLGFGSDTLSSLVYPWMPNGNLSEYLREYPDVDKLNLVSDISGCQFSRRVLSLTDPSYWTSLRG